MNIIVAPIKQEDIEFMEKLAKTDVPEGSVWVEIKVPATLWLKILKLLQGVDDD